MNVPTPLPNGSRSPGQLQRVLRRVGLYVVFSFVCIGVVGALVDHASARWLFAAGGAVLGAVFALGRFASSAPTWLQRATRPGFVILIALAASLLGAFLAFNVHASNASSCSEILAKVRALADRDTSPEEAVKILDGVIADASNGERACGSAGMVEDAEGLRKAREIAQRDRERALAMIASNEPATSRRASLPNRKSPDPSSCPKGQVIIDAETGKAIDCTGRAASVVPTWLAALGQIVKDPKGSRPSSVDTGDPGEVDYAYHLAPFSEATLSVFGKVPTRWTLALKSTSVRADGLSVVGGPTKLCTKGMARWYAIEAGDGPLAGSFASVGEPDAKGAVDIVVVSADQAAAEKTRDDANGAAPSRSVRESLCR